MRKLDFFIVGSAKAGTTTLYNHLASHPDVWLPKAHEQTFFGRNDLYRMGEDHLANRYHHVSRSVVLGAKYVHAMLLDRALDRLHSHNPEMRLLVMLREPVARAWSAYWFARGHGWETLTFEDAIAAERDRTRTGYIAETELRYVGHGMYAKQLSRCFELFGDRVHVIFLEDMMIDPVTTIRSVHEFLGISPHSIATSKAGMRSNSAAASRWPALDRLIYKERAIHKRIARAVVPEPVRFRFQEHVVEPLMRLNRRPVQYPKMDTIIERELSKQFQESNTQLTKLLGRSLPRSWIMNPE